MKIVNPKYIFQSGKILEEKAVLFGEKIERVGNFEELLKEFPEAEILETRPNTLLMAGLVNSHTHLEYSHHTTEYDYGSFIGWLNSVVRNFEKLSPKVEKMEEALESMLNSGTTAIGAISSLGEDLETLSKSPIRKVVFNEIIASQPHQVDMFYKLFLSRLESSEELQDRKFTPAVAIHSPYSVHHIVAKRVVELAKERNYPLSIHILESKAERVWLDSESGEFKDFYEKQYGVAKKHSELSQFFELLKDKPSLLVHGVYLNSDEVSKIGHHTLIHSPISNRLLGNGKLDLEKFGNWALATDGLSSNYTLSLFEEMKIALFLHNTRNLEEFATELFVASTETPAKSLNLNCGNIEISKDSDFILLDLGNLEFNRVEKIPLHTILNSPKPYGVYIFGERVK